ncbi:MAG: ExeM/NucH family extracellular endonuclease [Woeseiaceae bacterium]|nr:ExeM/NucH family extracellular endonuclease [Woeseiaceae bacterium]
MRNLVTMLLAGSLIACGGGGGSSSPPPPPPPPPPPTGTAIADIQGSGAVSPLDGQTVTIAGVVTGDFQDGDANIVDSLSGFYLQSETPDGDPATSDAVFVFDGSTPAVDVNVGDRVEVSGEVSEFFGETQIAASSVRVTGSGTIQPVSLSLPASNSVANADGEPIADLEAFEGMLVRIDQPLSVIEMFNLQRFGEVTLYEGGRPWQYTNLFSPEVAGFAQWQDAIARSRIVLDDGRRAQNVDPIRYLDAGTPPNDAVRLGDTVTGLTGTLRYSRGSGSSGTETWRLMPTEPVVFQSVNPRPSLPTIGGELRVASFNLLNFFTTIDNGQDDCGPRGNLGCRGADTSQEYDRQLEKTVTALAAIDADIVGLVEIENNAQDSLDTLVTALNANVGAGTYAFIDTGTIGTDAIKVGFIYKPASVSAAGAFEVLDSNVDVRFNDSKNRPALAQTFTQISDGESLTVVVNHLKSKGSPCDDVGDPNLDDGQGNCNQTRTNAALAIVDWLATDPTASGDTDFLIIGDMNAYLQEDPIQVFSSAGYMNLADSATPDSYTYVFDGQQGTLDHGLANSSLLPQIAGYVEWHINADEAPARDYNLDFGREAGIFDGTTPYRSSDHDPVIIGIDLN